MESYFVRLVSLLHGHADWRLACLSVFDEGTMTGVYVVQHCYKHLGLYIGIISDRCREQGHLYASIDYVNAGPNT